MTNTQGYGNHRLVWAATAAALALTLMTPGTPEANADVIGALTRSRLTERRLEAKNHRPATDIKALGEAEEETAYFPVIVKLAGGAQLPDFARELHRRGRLVLAMVAEDQIGELGATRGVERIEGAITASVSLVDAVKYCHAQEIMKPVPSGDSPAAVPAMQLAELTGKGVVTGLCDIGIEPNHLTFLDEKGKSRFRKAVTWELYAPEITITEGEAAIEAFATDDAENTHATHVAGILTGSGGGTAYRGIAPGSEPVVSAGPLADAYLLVGCEEIITYAKERGMPAVINISISSTTGPHDGTTLFNQYMEEICKDATVCISAGNDGMRNGYLEKTLAGKDDYLRTYLREYPNWRAIEIDGIADIWGEKGERFTVDILCTDFNSAEILHRYPAVNLEEGKSGLLICSDDMADGAEHTPLMDGLKGFILASGEINPENGRMNVAVIMNYADETVTSSKDARYTYGLEVRGDKGTRVEIYGSEKIFLNKHWDNTAMTGNPSRSVNDFCTGEGPICVGAMTSQNRNRKITGEWVDYPSLTIGDVTYFSSYGTLNDGRTLPHIVAPGAQTISALSSHYLNEREGRVEENAAFSVGHDGKEYYWGSMQGTSMSAPFAAGVFALWLEEDPTLTPGEIKRIAIETADAPTADAANPQWGLGILNAARGLEAVRDRAGTGSVRADFNGASVTALGNDRYRLDGLGAGRVSVWSLEGVRITEAATDGEGAEISLEGAAPGIYLIVGKGDKGEIRTKAAKKG